MELKKIERKIFEKDSRRVFESNIYNDECNREIVRTFNKAFMEYKQ